MTEMTPERRRTWIRAVLSHQGLTAAQRTVLVALETYADYNTGRNARPGETNLAQLCGGLTTRAVNTALSRGRALGLIEQTAPANSRAARAAVYRIIPVAAITGTTVPVIELTTGTAVPVIESTTGTTVPVNNSTTGTYASPRPERPFLPPETYTKTTRVLPNPGTSPDDALATHTNRPSRFCNQHPNGTPRKCGDCANARTAFKAWQATAAEHDVALASTDDLERRRRRKLIDDCQLCDDYGRLDDLTPCTHHGLKLMRNA